MHRDDKNGDAFFLIKIKFIATRSYQNFFICNRLKSIQFLRNLIMKFYRAYHHHLT